MANIRPLSEELQQKAIEELNEDVSQIPNDIQAIREWLQQQKYITARTDDQSILSFLRACKFSLERTKEKIETYYTMHTLVTDFLRNRDPFHPEIQALLKAGIFLPILKQSNSTAPRAILINIAKFDPNQISKDNFIKTCMMVADVLLNEDDQAIICGIQLIVECEGLKLAQLMSLALMIKAAKYIQETVPSRFKGLHMMNMPSFFETVFALVKAVMREKLRERVQTYSGNLDELYKVVVKEELPKEYGGNGSSLQELADFWKEKVESYAEWFKEDEKCGTNEKLRPGKPKTSQEMFGVEGVDGSFRKLNVD